MGQEPATAAVGLEVLEQVLEQVSEQVPEQVPEQVLAREPVRALESAAPVSELERASVSAQVSETVRALDSVRASGPVLAPAKGLEGAAAPV
jgi:hypothetical protein